MTRICVELRVTLQDESTCRAILSSVSVNDVEFPERQKLERRECAGNVLIYRVCVDAEQPEDVLSLWQTLDDLVRSLRAGAEVLEKVK